MKPCLAQEKEPPAEGRPRIIEYSALNDVFSNPTKEVLPMIAIAKSNSEDSPPEGMGS